MKALREAIARMGEGIGRDIVKVDGFLNHRVDTGLVMQMGQAFAKHFAATNPDIVLTVEASGISPAFATAVALGNIPLVFAKKSAAVNQREGMLTADVYSFTHKTQNVIRADGRYLPKGARVLIIDDFLADGQAAGGMISLIRQAGCTLCGVGAVIEKGFQNGGKTLRARGVNVLSLAVVTGICDGSILLDDTDEE